MRTIIECWQSIEAQYRSGALSDDQLEKIDGLVFSDNIENIELGLR